MRRIILAVVAGLLVLGGGAAAAWHYARPRLPAVTAVDQLTDRSIVSVVGAAGDDAAVTVTQLVATTACQHTMFAHGHVYTRTANLYTAAGNENALIARIAAGLPPGYHPSRANPLGSPVAPLTARPGTGVRLTVQVISDGWISATAQTDCRAGTPPSPPIAATSPVPSAVATVFTGLGAQAASWHIESVPCASVGSRGPGGSGSSGGGSSGAGSSGAGGSAGSTVGGAAGGGDAGDAITTIDAVSTTTDSSDLAKRLAAMPPPGATRFPTPDNRIAWRDGTSSTVISASDDGTHVTAQITTDTC